MGRPRLLRGPSAFLGALAVKARLAIPGRAARPSPRFSDLARLCASAIPLRARPIPPSLPAALRATALFLSRFLAVLPALGSLRVCFGKPLPPAARVAEPVLPCAARAALAAACARLADARPCGLVFPCGSCRCCPELSAPLDLEPESLRCGSTLTLTRSTRWLVGLLGGALVIALD